MSGGQDQEVILTEDQLRVIAAEAAAVNAYSIHLTKQAADAGSTLAPVIVCLRFTVAKTAQCQAKFAVSHGGITKQVAAA